jgi:hypothetical protein
LLSVSYHRFSVQHQTRAAIFTMREYCPPGLDRLRRLPSGRGMAGDAEPGRLT